jgi:pyridoxal 5'-phosphate synthase pdxS subunit
MIQPTPPAPRSPFEVKVGLARMLAGGVILDVTNADQARLAQDAGACAVMALERVPADIRREGGVARMAAIEVIEQVRAAVTIPVMAKARIGHFVEARILCELGVDFVDESEVLTPADGEYHLDKQAFDVPFVCGARDLGEALRRVGEGAAMIRSKGEAGTGDVVEAVRHLRQIGAQLRRALHGREDELAALAKELGAPLEALRAARSAGGLPVPLFAAGGVATPADAALLRALGAEAIFVGSGVFHSQDPLRTAQAIVRATAHFDEPAELLSAARDAGRPMRGRSAASLEPAELLAGRGW